MVFGCFASRCALAAQELAAGGISFLDLIPGPMASTNQAQSGSQTSPGLRVLKRGCSVHAMLVEGHHKPPTQQLVQRRQKLVTGTGVVEAVLTASYSLSGP